MNWEKGEEIIDMLEEVCGGEVANLDRDGMKQSGYEPEPRRPLEDTLVTDINKLGAYVERIPMGDIKEGFREQIMKRLAMLLIDLEGFN